ncbi:amidohydrolase [Paraburkholderia sp. Ac-20340]|uniref:amidohydrolase n=1 Tax=Paraburkholderia sp. Ac-20340 TaxID=2703888 RepID=UPI00197EB7D9|nr:amidohydrolase [Paraburkholderia sp. Ac-20340]MBN3852240.1 amidohydrolase [Paraburkholderia sp. Ac-20340]
MSDTIYHNARVYTVNDDQPWAEAIHVRDGKILAIGSSAEVLKAAGNAQTIDLAGRMVMPGIHDAHSHLIWAARRQLEHSCQLDDPQTLDELAAQLRAYWHKRGDKRGDNHGHKHADRGWLFGSVYNPLVFTADVLTRQWLDDVLPGVPIVIHDFSYHNVMANSLALAAAGIDRDTPSTPRGTVVKDAVSGEPTGVLREQAWAPLYMVAPEFTAQENALALHKAAAICNAYGITSVQEASANRPFLAAAKCLDDAGNLNLNLTCHIPWGSLILAQCERDEQERVIAERAQYAGKRVNVNAIKVALDGTSMAPTFSHVPLDPHTDVPITYNLLLDSDELSAKIRAWTADGMIVKSHCTGYGSVRIGLDNYERASSVERKPGQMHDIAHAHYVSNADRERFAELGVIAEMSPAIWHIPEYQEALGRAYDFRTLHAHGATMTVGSDWLLPPTPNLFPALAGMLEHGDESVPLSVGVRMLTLNGAIAVGRSAQCGSLEPGKDATFIVLDRNLFEASPEQIAGTQVLTTVLQGQRVFERNEAWQA